MFHVEHSAPRRQARAALAGTALLVLTSCPGKAPPDTGPGGDSGEPCLPVVEEATVLPLGAAPWDGLAVSVTTSGCEGTLRTTAAPVVLDAMGTQVPVERLDCSRYGLPQGFAPGSYTVTGLVQVPFPDGTTADVTLTAPVTFDIVAWGQEVGFDPTSVTGTTWSVDGGWDCLGLLPQARERIQPYLRIQTAFGGDLGFQLVHLDSEGDGCLLVQGAGVLDPMGVFTWEASAWDIFFDPRFTVREAQLRLAWNADATAGAGVTGQARVETRELSERYLSDGDALCQACAALGSDPCGACPDGAGTDCLPLSFHGATLTPSDVVLPDGLPLCDGVLATEDVSCDGCGSSGGRAFPLGFLPGLGLLLLRRRSRQGDPQGSGADQARFT